MRREKTSKLVPARPETSYENSYENVGVIVFRAKSALSEMPADDEM